jgi:hypothetical protein
MGMMMTCDQCGRRFDWDTSPKVVDNGFKIFPKHFCSEGCKRAFKGGGGSVAGGTAAGAVSGGIAGAIVSSMKETPEQTAAREKMMAEERANDRFDLESIRGITFDGESRNIVNSLSSLSSLCPSFMECIRPDKTKLVSAAVDKAEVGIRTLRSLGDNSNADYFEKKFKGLNLRKFAFPLCMGGVMAAMAVIALITWIAQNI